MHILEIAKKVYRRLIVENDIKKIYHKWIISNCEKSIYGKRLREIKNIHKGEKCIIVGNGPSLTSKDLDAICDANIITFGTNRIFKIFLSTKWRPTYYVVEDPDIIRGFCDEIDAVPSKIKFIPLQIKWYETRKKFKDVLYFWQNYDPKKNFKYSFSSNIDKQIDHTGTVTCTCIIIAAYMGFSEINLIGVDHSYSWQTDEKGNVVANKTIKNHFCENYNDEYFYKVEPPNLGKTTHSYANMRAYCDEHDIKIFNATRGGKLEAFERKSLDDIVPKNSTSI